MRQLRIFLFAFAIFSLLPTPATAQSRRQIERREARKAERDTVPLFKGFAVGYDVAGTVMRMVGDYGQIEGMLQANLRDKYFPVFECGMGLAKHSTDVVTGLEAKTNALFGRIGIDYNIAKNKHDDYRLLFGVRYGFTTFKQEVSGTITDPVWGGTIPYSIDQHSVNYHWGELVFSVDAKLWGPVRLGWSFRYKMKFAGDGPEGQSLWYVPGYGRDGDKLGGTFHVKIQLQRKNKKKPTDKADGETK